MDIEILRNLFVEVFGSRPSVKKIAGGGSPREYYRLQDNVFSVIGVIGDDIKENETFINLDYCLEENGINVPHVVAVDKNKKCYLLEDLGEVSLFNKLGSGQKNDLSRMALKELIRIQKLPESLWKHKVGFSPFNGRLVKWDLNYFKYDFLKPAGILFDEEKLEDDFESLTHVLVDGNDLQGFMYRDFQSRNIMVCDDELWFIDFQGARKGPMVYDAVSYIWQAKAPFTYEEREDLGIFYAGELGNRIGVDPEKIIEQMYPMEVFRTLQVL